MLDGKQLAEIKTRLRGGDDPAFNGGAPLVPALEGIQQPRAIAYDAGLAGDESGLRRLAWMDTEGQIRREDLDASAAAPTRPHRSRRGCTRPRRSSPPRPSFRAS